VCGVNDWQLYCCVSIAQSLDADGVELCSSIPHRRSWPHAPPEVQPHSYRWHPLTDCCAECTNLIWDFYSGLIRKELLLGPLECYDDVRKVSLKQECFEMSPEWMQSLSRCNFARQIVPHTRCSWWVNWSLCSERKRERKCIDFKCVWKPTKSRLSLTCHRWAVGHWSVCRLCTCCWQLPSTTRTIWDPTSLTPLTDYW